MDQTVLLIDDDKNMLHGMARSLRHQPYRLFTVTSGKEAMQVLMSHNVDVVVVDEQMPGMRGSELLAWITDHCPDVMRIMLTGHPTAENAIRAINEGRVYQYFTKPCNPAHLAVAIRKALEHKELVEENRRLVDISSRQVMELDRYRTDLDILIKTIAQEVQAPLQEFLRPQQSVEIENESVLNDCDAKEIVNTALEGLTRVAHLTNNLSDICKTLSS